MDRWPRDREVEKPKIWGRDNHDAAYLRQLAHALRIGLSWDTPDTIGARLEQIATRLERW